MFVIILTRPVTPPIVAAGLIFLTFVTAIGKAVLAVISWAAIAATGDSSSPL
jgi:hypothetical protein